MEEMTYKQYLNSSDWRKKANAAKLRALSRCQLCNESHTPNELHAHHRTYERLGHENEMDLTVLCIRCHEIFHDCVKMDTTALHTVAKVEPIKMKPPLSEVLK